MCFSVKAARAEHGKESVKPESKTGYGGPRLCLAEEPKVNGVGITTCEIVVAIDAHTKVQPARARLEYSGDNEDPISETRESTQPMKVYVHRGPQLEVMAKHGKQSI